LLLWASAAVWYCSTLSFLPYATRWSPRICTRDSTNGNVRYKIQ
jgi:hypothetical protein